MAFEGLGYSIVGGAGGGERSISGQHNVNEVFVKEVQSRHLDTFFLDRKNHPPYFPLDYVANPCRGGWEHHKPYIPYYC